MIERFEQTPSLDTSASSFAYHLCFYSNYVEMYGYYRCKGRSVRAVCVSEGN